jgi:hypothetical protein
LFERAKAADAVAFGQRARDAAEWGTDIYDAEKRWVGRSKGEFNAATMRPIAGVRRLMEINYVSPAWRDRGQLAFPDRPISLS